MNFPVPWRCLLPQEAVDFVTYNNNEILANLSDNTGALIDVSGSRDTPSRLSDRIVTISGQAEQKARACLGIVQKLRKLQDLLDSEIGFFVIIVPATAIPVIVGIKGATIAEVLEGTGVEISIGKENVMGMPDTPIGLEGTAEQVTTAVANIHKVVQDMADRGRLLPADFKYRPEKAAAQLAAGAGAHLPEVALPPVDHNLFYGMDPTQNFRTKAKIVVDTGLAGWLIGKGGRTIREMQENSGAFLHVIREEEPTPLLKPGDRLIEVCGRLERKLEGIQVVLRTADSMPGNAPRETRIIVPEVLAVPPIMEQVASAYNSCVVEREPGPACDGEAMLLIAGPIASRIQAIQDFMSKTDRAHIEGIVVAKSIDGEIVGKDGRARREIREGLGYAPINPPPPREPSPWLLRDPQPRSLQGETAPQEARAPPHHEAGNRFSQPPLEPPEPSRKNGDASVGEQRAPRREGEAGDPWPVEDQQAVGGTRLANETHAGMRQSQHTDLRRQQWPETEPLQPSVLEQPYYKDIQQVDDAGSTAWEQESNDLSSLAGQLPDSRLGQEREMFASSGMSHDRLARPSGIDEAMKAAVMSAIDAAPGVEALLQNSSSIGHLRGTLSVLLASDILFSTLVPGGHMQELAQRCQVHIDIVADASLPASLRQVVLTGSLASNAAAAYWLQVGTARHLATATPYAPK
ncbi:unnamed protein product [Symbiodinium natans]|uniref:K Homology domain-containing protein n=1 Tax=Symbiodinium natans TaxID=878477 RepID=A0A812S3F4_9DINO|nr:unnamed protein product [Symbiodinium natans]